MSILESGSDWVDYAKAIVDSRKFSRSVDEYKQELEPLEFNDQNQSQLLLHWAEKVWPVGSGHQIESDEIWACPLLEVKEKLRGFEGDAVLRLKQLLGLPPNSKRKWFCVFKATKGCVFRPSFDPNPTLKFPGEEPNEIYRLSCSCSSQYRESMRKWQHPFFGFPFTGLGYSYDWGSSNRDGRKGVSEYVLCNGSTVHVEAVVSNDGLLNYLKKL
jgi:hypothetical protein